MMSRITTLLVCALLLSASSSPLQAEDWSFAISGDSRNCGDIVMPSIAAGVHKDQASFYWHLGDFRLGFPSDEDMEAAGRVSGHDIHPWHYYGSEWRDFIQSQLEPFGDTPVFLTIGNHELLGPKNRKNYVLTFAKWLNQDDIRKQRTTDRPGDTTVRTYYHWRSGGLDLIALDNASHREFSPEQVRWFEHTLALAEQDASVKTVIVGMHAALPDSLAAGHSMNDWDRGLSSGRQVYSDLVEWHRRTKKNVYILASHSHFFMDTIFHTPANQASGAELPGWIVGTAGAQRYQLPSDSPLAKHARTNVYGYLQAKVHDDGTVDFKFHEINQSDVPPETIRKYGEAAVGRCFKENRDR